VSNVNLDLLIKGDLVLPDEVAQDSLVGVKNGLIVGIYRDGAAPRANQNLNASGQLVFPGLVDAHVHSYSNPNEGFEHSTAAAAAGGGISPSEEVTVECGTSQTFIIAPDKGHRVLDVLVDGESVGDVKEYVFKDVTEPHNIAASFTPETADEPEERSWKRMLPLLLSFVYCGIGQIYKGEVRKGIGFLLLYSLLILSFFVSLSSRVL